MAVLKVFGKGNENYLSFPIEGYTLALDFKISPDILKFLEKLDEEILALGGRIYLTKDVRLHRKHFSSFYPKLSNFLDIRRQFHAENFKSLQSERLGIS